MRWEPRRCSSFKFSPFLFFVTRYGVYGARRLPVSTALSATALTALRTPKGTPYQAKAKTEKERRRRRRKKKTICKGVCLEAGNSFQENGSRHFRPPRNRVQKGPFPTPHPFLLSLFQGPQGPGLTPKTSRKQTKTSYGALVMIGSPLPLPPIHHLCGPRHCLVVNSVHP